MVCPRCGYEGDVTQKPCERCEMFVPMAGTGTAAQDAAATQTQGSPPEDEDGEARKATATASTFQARSPLRERNEQRVRQARYVATPPPGASQAVPGSLPRPGVPGGQRSQEAMPRSAQALPGYPQMTPPLRSQSLPAQPGRSEFSPSSLPARVNRLANNIASLRSIEQAGGESARSGMGARPLADTSQPAGAPVLVSGSLLRNGRYRLSEPQTRHEWKSGTYETTWRAQDAQRAGALVLIKEVELAEGRERTQALLRNATVALMEAGRLPRVPALWDAFMEHGRNFFVFEPLEGETLIARLQRVAGPLSEQEVVCLCVHIVEVLEALSTQKPPLMHGLICPENIVISRYGAQYALTGFSVVQSGSGGQYEVDREQARLSPYAAPEMGSGKLDVRSDLYSLLATAYHAVTGRAPERDPASNTITSARRVAPQVSPRLDAILTRGLRPLAVQRYQSPAELKQDLLSWRMGGTTSSMGAIVSASGASFTSVAPVSFNSALPGERRPTDSVAQMLPSMLGDLEDEDKSQLPQPEDLPPMSEGNDLLQSLLWLGAIMLCVIVLVWASQGFL
ncbi:hypothetical protein KSB_05660 [Ktedonobacter robiniae]|uniref:Protein kinase domain-containing protein n=1 Tax=Ktedonobacter robiniae TaxID=2778365 RepID=A0ABQ3UH99_9CHLR|nr:hypothetical protein KSB_05660 [Ktedonobacter robiniae]